MQHGIKTNVKQREIERDQREKVGGGGVNKYSAGQLGPGIFYFYFHNYTLNRYFLNINKINTTKIITTEINSG